MSIYISRNNQQLGPFDEAKVRELLGEGKLAPDDLAIRQGEKEWQKLGTMFPQKAASAAAVAVPAAAAAVPVSAAAPVKPKKGRKGLLLGCGAFLIIAFLIAGVLGLLAYRNLKPADSTEDLPDKVKDFKLNNRYPPKGNIWGTEKTFIGIYSDASTSKTVIYMATVYASESAASDAMRSELASSCRSGETPMYFNFVKNGVQTSEGATCAVPFYVRKDNKLVTIGGSSAGAEEFINFAENLPFNNGAEMKRK